MKAKENQLDAGNLPSKPKKTAKSKKSCCVNPDKYLRHPEQHRGYIIECLLSARMQEQPPLNEEFVCLVKLWRLVAANPAPGQIPGADLEFLRWLLQGRARESIVYLRRQCDINVWYALKAIERTVNINIPEKQAMEHQVAMANWFWLKRELTGDLSKESRVDIRRVRIKR